MSVGITGLVVGPLQSNCYVVWDKATMVGAVIDPGGDLEKIINAVEAAKCTVEWVLLTHGHFDHIYYASDIAKMYRAKVAINAEDVEIMENNIDIASMFYNMSRYVVPNPNKLLVDGDIIRIGNTQMKVLHTPGHSPGGVCFDLGEVVFTGDTLFASSIGRTDFKGGSLEALMSSIQNKLFTLDDSAIIYPGHGLESTIGKEKRSNPYIKSII